MANHSKLGARSSEATPILAEYLDTTHDNTASRHPALPFQVSFRRAIGYLKNGGDDQAR